MKALIVLASLLFCNVASAGNQLGKVIDINVRASDGLVYFTLAGEHANRPACATNTYWMIKNENTDAGKRQLAVLMTARSIGASVSVYGAQNCTRWNDGEDVETLTLTSN